MSNHEIEAIRKEIEELKSVQIHRLINEPHRYYTPIGKFEEFINLIGSGKYITTLLSAANSIGKTYGAANLLANIIWPVNNKFFQHDLFLNWPYPKRGRIISDPTTVKETIIPTLESVFPKGRYNQERYTTTKAGKQFTSKWSTDTGWYCDIMTYEQDVKEFESATIGWSWMDEPPPEPIYKATIARFRLGGMCWITATPLMGSAWMYDEIVANQEADSHYRTFIHATVEDACKDHGVRGFLEHENIERQIAQYSEEDKQARIFGRFQHLTGLVFKKFHRKVHVVEPFNVNHRDYSVTEFLDPHPRNPDAVMWIATDRNGTKYVIDELYFNPSSSEELAMRVLKKAENYRVVGRFADPAAWNVDQHRKVGEPESLAMSLSEYGLDYMKASKDRQQGIRFVNDALNYQTVIDTDVERMVKPPQFYVFDYCKRTIWEFEHWQYNEWTGKTAERKNPSEKPQDKDDHMMENLGRAFLNDMGYVPYTGEQEAWSPLREQSYDSSMDISSHLDPFS